MDRSLPHSIELRAFLLRNNGDTGVVDKAIALYDHFCDRWTDTSYPVTGKPATDIQLRAAFEEGLDVSNVTFGYISRSELALGPNPAWLEYYDAAARQDFIRSLTDVDAHDKSIRRAALLTLFGRDLKDIVSSTLGSRRLQMALDNSFGSSFGRLIKHDILWLWRIYFSHILLRENQEAARLEKLIGLERTTPVLGKRKDEDRNWLLWVH